MKIIIEIVPLSLTRLSGQGTMLNPQDLQRVSAEKAAAVLVLCNKFSSDPSEYLSSPLLFINYLLLFSFCVIINVMIRLSGLQKAHILAVSGHLCFIV